MQDPRVRIVHDDVTHVIKGNVAGFDAIMLDTDNGPGGMLMSENAKLYVETGIYFTMAALRPGGIIAYWSVGEDKAFIGALQRTGLRVQTERVRAHLTSGPFHELYIATNRPPDQPREKQLSQRQKTQRKKQELK